MLCVMIRGLAACVLILCCPLRGAAQVIYTTDMLRDLPAGGNLFALLESVQAEVTTDRFNSGGLNAGDAERASGFLASSSQTGYFIKHALISSPVDGTPMVFPELSLWDTVSATTTRGGLSIDLVPRRPRQSGVVEFIGSGGGLTQVSSSVAPAIAQLSDYAHVTAIGTRAFANSTLQLTAGGAFTRATTLEWYGERQRDTSSAFVEWLLTPPARHTWRGLALVQQHARHVQSSYERGRLELFGAFTDRTRDTPMPRAFQEVDRIFDGPVPARVETPQRERRWSARASVRIARTSRHEITAGGTADRASSSTAPLPPTAIYERVDGVPARLWRFSSPDLDSHRHAWTLTAFASDRFALTDAMTIDANLTIDSTRASAERSPSKINWLTVLPSVFFSSQFGTPLKARFITGVARIADRPLLPWLAYGDPAAPTADVFRWDGENILPPPLMMRVGPGTGGDDAFSAIDPQLKRPVTDHFVIALEYLPSETYSFKVTGLAGRQTSLINVVNTGVAAASYSVFTIPDANADWVNPADDQQLTVYERRRETFGQDRYLLTNPDIEAATMGAVIVGAAVTTPRVLFRIDATASASVGSGSNRGFTAIENDQSVLGELFTNPNGSTYARGRLFNDRAYTIKSLAIIRLPSQISVGTIARFQDGQPFSRLAIVPFLNQGAEAIQTFPRGRSRFSYRATLDVRLQKRIHVGATRLDLIADAYNLLNAASEVEEYVVTGPRFREITAVQPPRAFHLGARVTF
jgi:hypothetical protein